MAVIESCLAVLGVASQVATVHGWISGLKAGKHLDRVLKELQRTRCTVEHLSDKILYAASIQEVHHAGRRDPTKLSDPRQLLSYLMPIQHALNERVLSTVALPAPQKLNREFCQNPWNVLVEITPINRFRRPTNPSLVPIIFFDGNAHYVGWQTNGIIRSSLDCEYQYRSMASKTDDSISIENIYPDATFHPVKITEAFYTDEKAGIYIQPHMDEKLLGSFLENLSNKGGMKISSQEVLLLFCDRIVKKAGLFSKVKAHMIGITSTGLLCNFQPPMGLKFSGIENFEMVRSYSDRDKGALLFFKKYMVGGGKFVFTLKGKQQYSVSFTNEKGALILRSVLSRIIDDRSA
jgi:hypothetical protein